MDIAARQIGANVLATAHNLDDFIQTFFINILSGDLKRIRWLNPLSESKSKYGIRKVKPFMEIYEMETTFFAYLKNLPFQSYTCPYMKESIRSEIRIMLNRLEATHPGLKYSIFNAAIGIAKGLSVKDGLKTLTCEICGYPSSNQKCAVCDILSLLDK